ncbi:MAG: type III-B CRISPR module RAMP protein Cmr4 [Candidatus Methylomirabilis sp.]|nr:type III-B CRISPR module RAMP protein Cmr4 [Candidatus Methylomirabilis sp.]
MWKKGFGCLSGYPDRARLAEGFNNVMVANWAAGGKEISVFTHQKAMFIYAVSPLHMGAGTALGLIDNPIQREVHTDWPSMAGSGIRGAIRHALNGEEGWKNGKLTAIFGPEAGANDLHAGAVSFTDAQIVCLPVRSLRCAYVYATCPAALARLKRLANAAWRVPQVKEQEAWYRNDDLKQGDHLILESLAFNANKQESVSAIANDLAGRALPAGFFSDKLKTDLVIPFGHRLHSLREEQYASRTACAN